MVSAINSALQGLQNATKQVDKSANQIAKLGTKKSGGDGTDALVKLETASASFKANVDTIKVADQMQQSLLDIKA